jgi:DNA-binding LytR/AlgR family response regulator
LLKPVRKERLAAALDRARARLGGAGAADNALPMRRKLIGRSGTDLHLFDYAEVIAFTADGELVYMVTASGRFLANHSLKYLETSVLPPVFRRIHRRTIINTDHIRRISPLTSKRWLLKLSNGMEVVVSKRMAGAVREVARR